MVLRAVVIALAALSFSSVCSAVFIACIGRLPSQHRRIILSLFPWWFVTVAMTVVLLRIGRLDHAVSGRVLGTLTTGALGAAWFVVYPFLAGWGLTPRGGRSLRWVVVYGAAGVAGFALGAFTFRDHDLAPIFYVAVIVVAVGFYVGLKSPVRDRLNKVSLGGSVRSRTWNLRWLAVASVTTLVLLCALVWELEGETRSRGLAYGRVAEAELKAIAPIDHADNAASAYDLVLASLPGEDEDFWPYWHGLWEDDVEDVGRLAARVDGVLAALEPGLSKPHLVAPGTYAGWRPGEAWLPRRYTRLSDCLTLLGAHAIRTQNEARFHSCVEALVTINRQLEVCAMSWTEDLRDSISENVFLLLGVKLEGDWFPNREEVEHLAFDPGLWSVAPTIVENDERIARCRLGAECQEMGSSVLDWFIPVWDLADEVIFVETESLSSPARRIAIRGPRGRKNALSVRDAVVLGAAGKRYAVETGAFPERFEDLSPRWITPEFLESIDREKTKWWHGAELLILGTYSDEEFRVRVPGAPRLRLQRR